MAEHPSIWHHAQYSARKTIGLPVAERIWLLRIGTAPLQWSAGGGLRQGFIYMNHPLLDNTPLWEFALSTRNRLTEVRQNDLPSDYYGMNDPNGVGAFGTNWSGHAIRAPDGQVFFARLVTNRSVVYVIQLAKQPAGRSKGRMEVEYVTVKNQSGR